MPHVPEQIALPRAVVVAVVVDEAHRWGSWARLAHADASFRWLRPADSVPNMTEEGNASFLKDDKRNSGEAGELVADVFPRSTDWRGD
jgi:hypothetical protein